MIIIDLIRHVRVDGKAALYGKTDVAPLVSENKRLLSVLNNRPNYDVILTSPLQRCYSVAQQLASKQNKFVHSVSKFQEMNFGVIDGVSFTDIYEKSAEIKDQNHEDTMQVNSSINWSLVEQFFQDPAHTLLPEAETLSDFNKRVSKAWQALLIQEYEGETQSKDMQGSKPKRIVLFAHGGVIRMILAEALGVDWKSPYWHQNLVIAHGSLTTITITRPFESKHFLQQVNNIAMPLMD